MCVYIEFHLFSWLPRGQVIKKSVSMSEVITVGAGGKLPVIRVGGRLLGPLRRGAGGGGVAGCRNGVAGDGIHARNGDVITL